MDLFTRNSATQAQCDAVIEQELGPIEAVNCPGTCSYTVLAATQMATIIAQFRDGSSLLPSVDDPAFNQLQAVHLLFFPRHITLGAVGSLQGYCMDRMRGEPYSTVVDAFLQAPQLHVALAEDVARYFAKAWNNAPRVDQSDRARIEAACRARLAHVAATVAPRFETFVKDAEALLDKVFAKDCKYPIIAMHGDLSEHNMFVDKDTGELTAAIDMAELGFLPFGFDFYALDEVLGRRGATGWTPHDNADEMRARFWSEFASKTKLAADGEELRTIKAARLVGVLFRYGTRPDAGFAGMRGVADRPTSSAMLDALLR